MSLPETTMAAPAPAPAPAAAAAAPPRVGYVLKMYPRFSETFVLNEVLALEELGADLEIFSLRPPADGRFHEALADVRAPVTYLPHHLKAADLWRVLGGAAGHLPGLGAHLGDLLAVAPDEAAGAVELAAAVRARGITHLHAHFGSVATTVARLAARLAGVGYSFTAHAKDIFHEDVDAADLRRKLADAAAVVTVSEYNLDFLRAAFPDATRRLVRLYNGLDLERFAYRPPLERAPVVVAVGRFVEKKGFAHLVDAIALLACRGSDVRLELVGSGAEEDALRERVSAHGLDARVTFHGPLPQRQVADVVSRAAVLAAPCVVGADGNRDGLPTVVLEALALGTPCVATPVTGMPEAVAHGRTGLLVPEADALALAAALERVLTEPGSALRYAETGRALVEERFDVRRNAADLLAMFTAASGAARTRGDDAWASAPAALRPLVGELEEVR
ncbi:glycosyltransferase [Georgenia sp. MJ206]|uniref:glycosyltransferase n=1 Tax=Georgenia wangjunii TaxID=3117730 RepID=UPI002F2645B5